MSKHVKEVYMASLRKEDLPSRFYEDNFRWSNNQILVEEQDLDLMDELALNDGLQKAIEICTSNHHPFDEVSYFINGIGYDLVNNIDNADIMSYIRLVDRDNGIYYGDVWVFRDTSDVRIKLFLNKEYTKMVNLDRGLEEQVRAIALSVAKFNILVGYKISQHRSSTIHKKIGSVKNVVRNHSGDSKARIIRLRELPELRLSTYIEGNGSKPTHEFGVRGHIRRYKNGKEVYIKPYRKCVGRGEAKPQIYSLS